MKTVPQKLRKLWWIPLFTGIIALGLGIWEVLVPQEAIPVLAIVFAVCLLLTGVLNLFLGAFTRNASPIWGWGLALGIIEMIGGVWMLTLPLPEMTVAFILIVGFMVIVASINAVVESFSLAADNGWWVAWSILLLIAAIVLIIIMFSNPLAYGVAAWICLGCALMCFGVYRIGLSFVLKKFSKKLSSDVEILM